MLLLQELVGLRAPSGPAPAQAGENRTWGGGPGPQAWGLSRLSSRAHPETREPSIWGISLPQTPHARQISPPRSPAGKVLRDGLFLFHPRAHAHEPATLAASRQLSTKLALRPRCVPGPGLTVICFLPLPRPGKESPAAKKKKGPARSFCRGSPPPPTRQVSSSSV